jgi:hypothetical protein
MNPRVVFNLILIFSFAVVQGKSQHRVFDKSAFYAVIKSGNTGEIEDQIIRVRELLIPEKDAYEGTLLMKKSGLVAGAKEKLSIFKSGRSKLESSISKDSNNTEYRFLRLIIQEHAPKVVKYQKELETDSKMIQTNFKGLSPFLQQVIFDYSKNSKVLKMP